VHYPLNSLQINAYAAFYYVGTLITSPHLLFSAYVMRHKQCFSWVGTAFPQIFPCVLLFVKVEITPPVHYTTS
jgi:hypothetical protein